PPTRPLSLHDALPICLVCLKDVHRLPSDEWDIRSVADIMTAVADLATLSPDDDGVEALNALNRRNVNQIPVVDGGRVVGIVRREDRKSTRLNSSHVKI